MAEHDGAEHDLFRKLLGFRFHHQHGVLRAGDDEVERGQLLLLDRRVQHIFAVDVADARRTDRAHEGNAGEREGGRGGDQREDVGVVLEVIGEHGGDHLRLVAEALDEERADRAVDQARDQRLALGRAAFALEIAARDLAGGIGLFLVVDGQREEVDPGLCRALGNGGGENGGFTERGEHGAIGLTGHAAGFEAQRLPGPLDFFDVDIEHVDFPLCPSPPLERRAPPLWTASPLGHRSPALLPDSLSWGRGRLLGDPPARTWFPRPA